jgi:hypothetical protein
VRYRDLNFRPALSFLYVGDGYDPRVGFVRRQGIAETSLELPVVAYPDLFDLESVTLTASGSLLRTDEFRDDLGKSAGGSLAVSWPSWGFDLSAGFVEDVVTEPFDLLGRIPVAPGTYEGVTAEYGLYAASQLNPYGSLRYSASSAFFGGIVHTVSADGGVALGPHFRVAGAVSQSFVRIPGWDEEHALAVNATITVAPSTLLTADLILQLNDLNEQTTALVRLRWRYLPGSDLFFVYRQDVPYDCYRDGFSCTTNAELTLKVSYRFDALL